MFGADELRADSEGESTAPTTSKPLEDSMDKIYEDLYGSANKMFNMHEATHVSCEHIYATKPLMTTRGGGGGWAPVRPAPGLARPSHNAPPALIPQRPLMPQMPGMQSTFKLIRVPEEEGIDIMHDYCPSGAQRVTWEIKSRALNSEAWEACSSQFEIFFRRWVPFRLVLQARTPPGSKRVSFRGAKSRCRVVLRSLEDSDALVEKRTDAFVLFNIQVNSLEPRGPVGHDFAADAQGGLPETHQHWNLGKSSISKAGSFTASIDILAVGAAAKGAYQSGAMRNSHMQCWATHAF